MIPAQLRHAPDEVAAGLHAAPKARVAVGPRQLAGGAWHPHGHRQGNAKAGRKIYAAARPNRDKKRKNNETTTNYC